MFGQPMHLDSYLNPIAETVYAVTFFGTGVALPKSNDGRDPECALRAIRCGQARGRPCVVAAGCFEHTYTLGAGAPAGPVVYDEWQNHWLGGLIGERTHELGEVCPSGNATIHDEQTFLNGLVAVLTSGIYTPTTVTIRCSTGQSAQLQLSRKEVVSILTAPAFRERLETVLPGRFRELESGIEALEKDLADG